MAAGLPARNRLGEILRSEGGGSHHGRFLHRGLISPGPESPSAVEHATISRNCTSWLDIIALVAGSWLLYLFLAQRQHQGH